MTYTNKQVRTALRGSIKKWTKITKGKASGLTDADLLKLAAVKAARDALREAAKVRCTCSGLVIQYEGGCCCESSKGKRAAEDRLKQAIDAL
jgi:hypothetical protein